MELKHNVAAPSFAEAFRFNRTFMELKLDKDGEPYYASTVLIGPSWN